MSIALIKHNNFKFPLKIATMWETMVWNIFLVVTTATNNSLIGAEKSILI